MSKDLDHAKEERTRHPHDCFCGYCEEPPLKPSSPVRCAWHQKYFRHPLIIGTVATSEPSDGICGDCRDILLAEVKAFKRQRAGFRAMKATRFEFEPYPQSLIEFADEPFVTDAHANPSETFNPELVERVRAARDAQEAERLVKG